MWALCLVAIPLAQSQATTEKAQLHHAGLADHSATPLLVGLAAQDWTTLLSEDLEGDFPGSTWALYGDPTWGKTSYRAHSGSYSAYCANGGSGPVNPPGPYPNNMDSAMVYGPFDLSQAADAEVQFWYWSTTFANDYLGLVASPDSVHWGGKAWAGSSGCSGWCQETFSLTDVADLGNLCGQPRVWIAFVFHSDASIQYEGSYLDDITVRALAGGAQPSATPTTTPTPTVTATGGPTRTPTPTRTMPAGGGRVYLPIILRAHP